VYVFYLEVHVVYRPLNHPLHPGELFLLLLLLLLVTFLLLTAARVSKTLKGTDLDRL